MIEQILVTIVLVALGSWLLVTPWIFAYTHWLALKKKGVTFGRTVTWGIYPFLVIGAVADVLFNVTWGSWLFNELPREWFFTQRVQRHYHGAQLLPTYLWGERHKTAREWAQRINKIDPGHIK